MIESGQIYSIEVTEDGDWKDKDLPADADGVNNPSDVQNLMSFTKRVSNQPWFKVIASVGPSEGELIPIGKKKTFMAKTSGQDCICSSMTPTAFTVTTKAMRR